MTGNMQLQMVLYLLILLALVKPLGWYMARVFEGKPCGLDRVLGPVERLIYRASGVNPAAGNDLEALRRGGPGVQRGRVRHAVRPPASARVAVAEPRGPGPPCPTDLSFNTAVSFLTNTNWQAYGGETTMSYLTQMVGLAVQNFLSAATGMAVLVALIRGFARRTSQTIGNFWVDLIALDALHPAAAVARPGGGAGVAGRGADASTATSTATLVEPMKDADGKAGDRAGPSPWGRRPRRSPSSNWAPTAAASSTPTPPIRFENPTPLSNFLEMLAILLIPAALCYTFGKMVGDTRQGWAVLAAMIVIFVVHAGGVLLLASSEARRMLAAAGADIRRAGRRTGRRQHGGQGGPLRHRQLGALGDGHDGAPRTARSTRCTTPSRRWAAWCRCG